MVEVNNYSFHCPAINETVNADIRIDSHREKDCLSPEKITELDQVKNLEYCSGLGRCAVKIFENGETKYYWDRCPLQKKLSRD